MASGDFLIGLTPLHNTPPATIYATFDTMTGTSTPAESIPVLDFDDTTVEYADFYLFMPAHYAGTTGVTLTFVWSAAAAANNGIWAAAFRRVADDAEDLDTTAHTYVYNDTGDITAPSAIGEVSYDDITFTDGADMDSVVADDYAILRVRRPAPSGTKITGDCSIHAIHLKET